MGCASHPAYDEKKTTRYREAASEERPAFLRKLREWIRENGSQNMVYVDESGFYADAPRPHGWAKRGTKVHGLVTGNKKKGRINLIMAQRKDEWLAPMLFNRSCTHHTVNA